MHHGIVMLAGAAPAKPGHGKSPIWQHSHATNPLSSIYQSTDTYESFFCHKF